MSAAWEGQADHMHWSVHAKGVTEREGGEGGGS